MSPLDAVAPPALVDPGPPAPPGSTNQPDCDPFDCMLAARAEQECPVLLSADPQLSPIPCEALLNPDHSQLRAPQPLLDRLAIVPTMASGRRRLVVLMGQLGDFDSLEYAQALAATLPRLEAAGIALLAIGLGNAAGAARFCSYTGLPPSCLQVDATPELHQQLGLYAGVQTPLGPWPALLLMCAGIGSPGTLAEVLRGYSGDRQAPPRLELPLFNLVGRGYQRPFELATVRLQNMVEVLGHWRTYVPSDDHLSQRGGTFLLDGDDSLLYGHRDAGILGFSATMARPLSFLDPWLSASGNATGSSAKPGPLRD